MRILVISDNEGVSEFYRSLTPYRLLWENDLLEDLVINDSTNPAIIDHLGRFDAVVFSRADNLNHSLILAHAKLAEVPVILDVDDNLLLVPPSIGAYGHWFERGGGKIKPRLYYFKKNIRLADTVTVSTEALGQQLVKARLRSPGDYRVLPNQILAQDWLDLPDEIGIAKAPGEQWVGWWGIYNHWDDWRDIAPYIEPVILDRPNTKLILLGMPELALLFPRLIDSKQFISAPFTKPDNLPPYRVLLSMLDVALAPTSDNEFNRSKSDLKVLQYGAAGVPVIASPATYGHWGEYINLAYSPQDWTDLLINLLSDPQEGIEQGKRLYNQVMTTRTYEANFQKWLDVLNNGLLIPPELALTSILDSV